MANMFEFKKWGNGSSCYEVLWLSDYNPATKLYRYTPVGLVQKEGSKWVGMYDNKDIKGKTRKEAANKLVEKHNNK